MRTVRSSRGAAAFTLAWIAALAFLPAGARAANLKVPRDYPTLADAIAAAVPGVDEIWASAWADSADTAGTVYYYLDPTLYELDSTLVLGDGLVYRGGWDAGYLTQNTETRIYLAPGATGSVLDASMTGGSTVLTNFTIGPPQKPASGATTQGGGLFVLGGSLLVTNCLFENNVSDVSGGAIQIGTGSAAHILDCTFLENATGLTPGSGRGGAIAVGTGGDNAHIENCVFRNNAADSAGSFTSGAGGALFTAAPIRVERCKFTDNYCGSDGGAMYVRNASVRGWGNLFYFNRAGRNGGAMYWQNGSGELSGTLIEDCQAGLRGFGNGGGVYWENGSNRFTDGYVRRCEALAPGGDGFTQGIGGAFYLFEPGAPATIRGTEIVGNRAEVGGGIAIQGGTGGTFSDAAITNNTLDANFCAIADSTIRMTGAGLHVFDNFLGEVVNNVFSEQEDGAAIACEARIPGTQPSPNIRYNCVWNGPSNPDPEYGGICVDRTNLNGNIRQNPGLCCFAVGCVPATTTAPDLQLAVGSPCLGTGEGGVDMGAHAGGTNCMTPISLEPSSWGAIKARYR